MPATKRYHGTVQVFNTFDGGGMILLSDGREVLVRYSAIRGKGVRQLQRGSMVSFQLEETPRGLYAVCVQEE
jgi:CspA family cold shock protein